MAVDVGQATFDAVVVEAQALVIEAEQVQDRGVEVVDSGNVLDRHMSEVVGRPVAVAGLHARAGKPDGESLRVMVAAVGAFLEGGHSAELGHESHERVLEQAAGFKVLEKRRGRLVENGGVHRVLADDALVAVPVTDAFAHGVGPVEELDEAHALLEQATGKDAVLGEASLVDVGVVSAVHGAGRGRFAGEVGELGGVELHAGRELIGRDASGQVGVPGILLKVLVVEPAEVVACRAIGLGRDLGWAGEIGDGALGAERRALEGSR